MKKGVRALSLLAVLSTLCGFQSKVATMQAPAVQTLVGAKIPCPAARDQPCNGDNCAHRLLLSATLPPGATYVGTHYFTNAGYPDDYADVRETGPTEVSYARFSEATHAKNSTNQEVVTVYYYNRSNRNRVVSINVDYAP
jgi:hypothetical protein